MSDKPSKTMYQSELVQLGAVSVTVKSDVMRSKYKGKPNYVVLLIDGHERIYNCENRSCEDALAKRKGQKLMIEAVGSRDEAEIKILGAGAEQEQSATEEEDYPSGDAPPQKTQAPAQQPKPSGGKADPVWLARQRAGRHANAMIIGLEEAYYLGGQFFAKKGIELTSEDMRSIAISCVIDLDRCGLVDGLPSAPIEMKASEPAKK